VFTVVLPTRNDPAVVDVIRSLKLLPMDKKIWVVDYKSTDGTRELAEEAGAEVFDEPLPGKGVAVANIVKKLDTPYVVFMDADYTYPAMAVPDFIYLLENGADSVVGYRCWKGKGAMPLINRVGNFGLSIWASILYKTRVMDVNSGMWGFRRETIQSFNIGSKGFTLEAEFFIKTIKSGARFEQTAITYKRREKGTAKLKVTDGIKIGVYLLQHRIKK